MAERRKLTKNSTAKTKNAVNCNNFSTVDKPASNAYNSYLTKENLTNIANKTFFNNKIKKNTSTVCKKKVPLYNNPFYSPNCIIKRVNYKILYPKNKTLKSPKTVYSCEYSSSFISSTKRDDIVTSPNNTINPRVYIKKNTFFGSPKSFLSEDTTNRLFQSQIRNSCLNLTPNIIETYNEVDDNNLKETKLKNKNNNKHTNRNKNYININLYNKKNSYAENDAINKVYINKSKTRTSNKLIFKKKKTKGIINNNINENNGNNTMKERSSLSLPFYYSNINVIKKIDKNIDMKINPKTNIKCLSKIKKRKLKNYDESAIIKIQSVIRGYLLIKKLDNYLKHYMRINDGIKSLERSFKNKFFSILKKKKRINRNYNKSQNKINVNRKVYFKTLDNNKSNAKNAMLKNKIIELINEKNELQSNYDNLKEFIKKYNDLIKDNQEKQIEINKLKLKNNDLLAQLNNIKESFNKLNSKNNNYIIQKENNISIIEPKRFDLIYPKNNINYENNFFTLGKENEEVFQSINNEYKKMNKLKFLFHKQENNYKFNLFKNFLKFYYFGLYNQINIIPINYNRRSQLNAYNKFNFDNSNYLSKYMSIKTLSDNSSVLTDKKVQNIRVEKNISNLNKNILEEEENEKK